MRKYRARKWMAAAALGFAVSIVAVSAHAAGTVPTSTIQYAIGELERKGDQGAFTKSGKPRVKALEEILGADISAAERDAAWKTYSPPKPAASVHTGEKVKILNQTLKEVQGQRDAALATNAKLKVQAKIDVENARKNAVAIKARYISLVADAKRDRAAAAKLRQEAKATLAEARKREAGSGPAVNRACRGALGKVLNAGFSWTGNLKVTRTAVLDARVKCLQQ